MQTDEVIILIDIGSTFTKITAVDLAAVKVVARSNSPTTPNDVSIGLGNGLENLGLSEKTVVTSRKLACSSAAGGLRMVAIGLVEDLTAKAARQAALGAGARVLRTYSFQLTDEDREEIIELEPDIILLAGGTDGGNTENILHNAGVLASLPRPVPVVIAGNRSVSSEVAGLFPERFSTYIASNVMPQIGKLVVEPAREVIRKVFMEKIVFAKGLSKAARFIEGIFMPTPAAVLKAGQLLSTGTRTSPGWGDLMIVDVGGATTDIHSFGSGQPTTPGVVLRGLPEPHAKRTVEGDLGMRVSVLSLLEAAGAEVLSAESGWSEEDIINYSQKLSYHPELLPQTQREAELDAALARQAARLAVGRHVGRLSELYTPSGLIWMQDGKDLSEVERVIGTGGVLVNSREAQSILTGIERTESAPLELRPKHPRYFLDGQYVLAPMGLLASEHPREAIMILKDLLNEQRLVRKDG